MRARAGRTVVLGFLLATFAAPASLALAQEAPAAPPAGLVPPKLVQGATPEYPESKQASAEKASVTLSLTIARDGSIESVAVTTSAGTAFDDAAVAAAKKLVFSPATRDGKAITARIPYRFDFAFEAPAATVAPAAEAVVLEGAVRTAGDEPVPGATVTATAASGQSATTTTDAAGAFRFKGLAPGSYQVTTTAEGFAPFASKEDVVAGEVATVTYRPKALASASPEAAQEIRVVGERPAREVTRRALEQREIARIPGTNGDAIRAVENMPGVARPPGLQGLLIVRGSAPQDTGIFVDGTQVPIAFHFGGVSSVIPSALLERIDFLPGNFGPEYGRSMGGNVDIGLRSPARDKIHAMAQIDLIDARFVFEAPLGEKTRFLVAGRRSHVDAWIGGVLETGGAVGVRTAPVYYDYQAMLEHDVTPSTTARLTVFGSDDALRLTLNSTGADPALAGNFDDVTRFVRVQARTDTRVNDRTRWINTVSYGRDMQRIALGNNIAMKGSLYPLTLRSDLRTKLADSVTAIVGIDTVWSTLDATVNSTPIPEDGQASGPLFARQRNLQTVSTSLLQPAGYAMLEISPVKALKLLPSARADYSSDIKEWAVSPRFAARYDVASGYPRTTLKGGVGLYHQPPQVWQSLRPFGTPNLENNRALHTSLGFEQELSRQVEVSVEGFYKKLDKLVDQRADATHSQAGVGYANSGSGRIYGGELLLRYKPDARFFGWIAYTISRSERRADSSESYRSFDYDQTHILTALGSYRLGRGWEVGARFRYVTGTPYTPVASAIYDADAGAYAPVNATPFSGRDEAFHSLDVRVDKTWTFTHWKLGAYLDVQNAYNRNNADGRSYNYNYARAGAVSGLPLLPVIGLRGEL
ncbi:MAG TPA: TonB family protein [Labilithrix sp.]|nr:TonB family protein [Labilithrix sp.]